MRKIIAALVVSLDGYIEDAQGEVDWIDSWEDPFDVLDKVDVCVVGANMYPAYEEYWSAVYVSPDAPLPFSGKTATKGEIDYARFAMRTPHVVVSTRLQTKTWQHTRIVRGLNDVRELKQQSGGDIHVVGGAVLVSSLINADLVDELRIVIAPILLGAGKSLFQSIEKRRGLQLQALTQLQDGWVRITYSLRS
jgi:dihydrofolate reductase